MKSLQSYFLISAIVILSIFTGIFIWRNKHLTQIPKFNEESFNTPVSSNYIPTNTDLVFHWKLNPGLLPKYIENYQDEVSKHAINKQISFIISPVPGQPVCEKEYMLHSIMAANYYRKLYQILVMKCK